MQNQSPTYLKTPGGQAHVDEVLMPGDLCSYPTQHTGGYPQSMTATTTGSHGHYSPTTVQHAASGMDYSEKGYGSLPGHQARPPPQRQASSQYRQAVAIPNLGMSPSPVDCPSCGQRCMTSISYHSGNTTHVWAGIACLITGLLCFVPYLMNSMKDVQHRCGNCGVLLATWHKSGTVEPHMHA